MLEISLSPEAETRLRERAAAAGKQPAELARAIVERDVRRPTLEEISGPIYQEFLRSGMTDEELGDMLDEAKHAMRQETLKLLPSMNRQTRSMWAGT